MKLSEKLTKFLSGANLDEKIIEQSMAINKGINLGKNIELFWFEEHCSIGSPVIASHRCCFIGSHSYVNQGGYIRGYSFIGRFSSIGRRVSIGAGVHSITGLSTSPAIRNGTAKPYNQVQAELLNCKKLNFYTIIMNDVWIGDGTVIMPGVKVHSGSIIGANSVVTKDVPPYEIVAGQPARTIKKRFPKKLISDLLESEWWETSKHDLEKLPTGNVFDFIDAHREQKAKIINSWLPTYQIKG